MPIGNQLGDMLREMRDPALSPQREEEIVRILNELGGREEKYKSWLQDGSSDPYFKRMGADYGDFKIPPVSGSYYGSNSGSPPQTIPNASSTPLTTVWEEYKELPDSAVFLYPNSNALADGKFQFNPSITKNSPCVLSVSGSIYINVAFGTLTSASLFLSFQKKSDDSVVYGALIYQGNSPAFPFVFHVTSNSANFLGVSFDDMYCVLALLQNSGASRGIFGTLVFERKV